MPDEPQGLLSIFRWENTAYASTAVFGERRQQEAVAEQGCAR